MKALFLIVCLASTAAAQIQFPPGATVEEKKAIIRERMASQRASQDFVLRKGDVIELRKSLALTQSNGEAIREGVAGERFYVWSFDQVTKLTFVAVPAGDSSVVARLEGSEVRRVEGISEKDLPKPPAPAESNTYADAGEMPDGDSVVAKLRTTLKDPDSLIAKWQVLKGKTPGGNAAWVVVVTWRAKNGYGAYDGDKVTRYYFRNKEVVSVKTL